MFIDSSSPKKKHKHKHKKHKKRKDYGAEGYEDERKRERSKEKGKSREKDRGKDSSKDDDSATNMGRAVKLKIKLGGQTMATTQYVSHALYTSMISLFKKTGE